MTLSAQTQGTSQRGATFIRNACIILFAIEVLLGIAHFLWPEYRWGQGRRSYFNLDNRLTLASWLASMQLVAIAGLAVAAFLKERRLSGQDDPPPDWRWPAGAFLALALSFIEFSRPHHRFSVLGLPDPDLYEQFVILPLWIGALALLGWFLLSKLSCAPGYRKFGVAWLVAWGVQLVVTVLQQTVPLLHNWISQTTLIRELAFLSGGTFLLLAVGACALGAARENRPADALKAKAIPFPEERRMLLLLGVGGMTFSIIFLEIVLFQMLTIFGDLLTANSVISIAMLGISIGGLVGFFSASSAPVQAMIGAGVLLPVSVILALGAPVSLPKNILAASVLLMLPFICASTVVTVVLARMKSHVVYFVDLLGAAVAALVIGGALTLFREESSILFLGAFTCLAALCFAWLHPKRLVRGALVVLLLVCGAGFITAGDLNLDHDGLNIVRVKLKRKMPQAKILFSRSSFVGRYDVVRRSPSHGSLSAYNNGRIIDTVRNRPAEYYQIDPRLPHTLMEDPVILILGLSGDGIAKTARTLCSKVYGVEINPAVVELQTNELLKYNADSYRDIEVAVMDGRSYVEQSRVDFDMITLMNAHSARGRTSGRGPSPEYLHTYEAMQAYLERLTDRGVVIVEEPVSNPRREPPIWKLTATMRQVLVDRGSRDPQRHFFIFQWRTKRNNYIQILMKKTPFTDTDVRNLKKWLRDVDDRKKIERREGRRMGPISTKTTLLHAPGEPFTTNYARIVRGELNEASMRMRNLRLTTDDRPYHFDVNPKHPEIKRAYHRTLLMTLLLIPFFLWFAARYRSDMRTALPYLLVVCLSGFGYFLIEVVLIQRYEIFLGKPVVAFATVLGTLLVSSGLGSLWSGRFRNTEVFKVLGALLLVLLLHLWLTPMLLPLFARTALPGKVALAIATIAPLGFFMGIPFPYVLRTGKSRFSESAAAMLFAINAAGSAVAVPLAFNISTSWGMNAVFLTGIVVYASVGLLLLALLRRKALRLANGTALILMAVILLSPWLMSPQIMPPSPPDLYEVYGISYGRSFYGEDKVLADGSANAKVRFQWLLYLIKGNGRTVLVDTGTENRRDIDRFNIKGFVPPKERLRKLGIAPNDVTDVILTHLHWDHAGSLGLFRNARVWLQAKEYEHARTRFSSQRQRSGGMRREDWDEIIKAEKEDRLRLVSGEHELATGLVMTLGGAHTPGFQHVSVETLDGKVVIAGDATFLYHNNRWHRPIGLTADPEENLAAIRSMHGKAASPFFILPGHDRKVMKWFPKIAEGIVKITSVQE